MWRIAWIQHVSRCSRRRSLYLIFYLRLSCELALVARETADIVRLDAIRYARYVHGIYLSHRRSASGNARRKPRDQHTAGEDCCPRGKGKEGS